MAVVQTGWSADGNWFWDGARWNDALSEDGKWRFDGSNWQPFAGQRTAMPAQPFGPPPPPPPLPPAPAAPVRAATAMPSWVAASEIQRMENEKIEARLAQMTPADPLPPDRDWRRVGEFTRYTPTARGSAFWRTGWTSALIYIGLLWLCSPLAVVFVWMTTWRTFTKVYRTAISLAWSYAALNYIATHYNLG